MTDQTPLAVAELIEIDLGTEHQDAQPTSGGRTVKVQFNPESLKLTAANTVARTEAAGTAAMQYVGASSTKLDLELWFDATVDPQGRDLRTLTEGVHHFITPQKSDGAPAEFKVPGVRLQWGAFTFDGVMTTLNETLDLFSHDGRPLRSRIALSFSAQEIRFRIEGMANSGGSGGGATPGVTPQTPLAQGTSVQQAVTAPGATSAAWKSVAAANGIENPRFPETDALIGATAGAGAGLQRPRRS
ncbi:peptidoglycan-binding protein [Nocardioides gilvus]|uniref:CIS tube protein n=1 Tax=Nocardioides gilvus TaxID=1735589 RepID=UPI000D74B9FB|nr:peptidoglycan-binding protein [Nocardioides gilvus]